MNKKTKAAIGLGVAVCAVVVARDAAKGHGAVLGLSPTEVAMIVAVVGLVGPKLLKSLQ